MVVLTTRETTFRLIGNLGFGVEIGWIFDCKFEQKQELQVEEEGEEEGPFKYWMKSKKEIKKAVEWMKVSSFLFTVVLNVKKKEKKILSLEVKTDLISSSKEKEKYSSKM